MPIHIQQADLPYTPRQVFDLVADIESYPKFLSHVVSARIRQRNNNILLVDQMVQLKVLRLPFTTRAVLDPPVGIHVVCSDSMFGTFDEQWKFTAGPHGGTHLQCRTNFQFRSGLLRMALDTVLGDVTRRTIKAFEARALKLYGAAETAA